MYQQSYCIYSSSTPFYCMIKRSNFLPLTADQDLNLSAMSGSVIVDSSFPKCSTALNANTGVVDDPAIGVCTWPLVGCHGIEGPLSGVTH